MEEIEKIMQECNSNVIAIMCKRLASIGELSRTDAIRLVNLSRTQDLEDIMQEIANATNLGNNEIEKAVEKASKENDALAEKYYRASGTTQDTTVLNAIKKRAVKSMQDDLLNLSDTTAFVQDGKVTSIRKTYTNLMNKGIYATQQGLTTYNEAIRGAVKQLTDSGLRTVDFDSGYARRLDSQVRMNVLDGIRQMNMEYREQQGEQFGADGVEISVHSRCALDHLDIQGKQYSNEKWEKVNNGLKRPIGTCNCHHTTFPIIIGISEPVYSKEELDQIKQDSTRTYTYTDKLGNERECNGYEATQKQRQQETCIRRLKDARNAYELLGDEQMVKEYDKRIREQNKYYREMSNELNLNPKPDRLRVVKASTVMQEPKPASPTMDINMFTTRLQELEDIKEIARKEMKAKELEVLMGDINDPNHEKMWAKVQELSAKYQEAIDNIEKFKVDNPALWEKWQEIEAEKNKLSDEYLSYKKGLEHRKIEHRPVKKYNTEMTIDKKIQRLAGADKTSGSCASLGLCYIGQKLGYDVLDFRGGASMDWFASKLNKIEMWKALNVESITVNSAKTSLTNGKRALKQMEKGKEYYLSVGRHASIVRLNDDGVMQYLELQSSGKNGWKDIEDAEYTLSHRFGCSSSSNYYNTAYLTDIEQLKDNKEFIDLLGFINTDILHQLKGAGGYAK